MVTQGPFSTSTGASPVPYLTGAFAGSGQFTVSPILGYQTGGLNADGTPNTTSRQFQAGLSVTGKGANQNATLFVMTSQISNAPNIGFTQAGGFMGVTMRNPAGWYGMASGAVSSATPTSAPNTVPTMNGVPIASFALNNTNTNLNTGTVSNSQSYNYVQSGPANYKFNPLTTGTPTTLANNHPTLSLNGYVGGLMVTATGGTSPPFTNYTKPYVITNLGGAPGDVSILLPGDSSEMLAIFNVASVNPPTNGMTNSTYVFGSLNGNGLTGLNTARGTYVNPSNFAARDAAVFDNGANTPVSVRNGQSLASIGGYANQQLVTATSVGANTSAFLTSISSTNVQPCACESTQWGFWSAFNGATNNNGQLVFEDQGALLLWVAGIPTTAGSLPATGTATYTGHAIANIATGTGGQTYLAAGTFSAAVNFGARNGAVTIGGLDGTNYAGTANWVQGTTSFATPASSPLIGQQWGSDRSAGRLVLPGRPDQYHPALRRDGWFAHPERDRTATSEAEFSRREAVRARPNVSARDPVRLLGRGGQRLERGGDFPMREVGGEKRQPLGFVAVRVDQHDRAASGLLPQRQPGVGAERDQVELADRLHQRIAGDETGEAEEQRRGLAIGDQKPLGVEDFLLRIDALRQQEVRIVRQLAAIGVVIGVIGPQDVERAGIALTDEPAEIVEVMDKPEA